MADNDLEEYLELMLSECLIEWLRELDGVVLRNEDVFCLVPENDREDDNGVEVADKLRIDDDAGSLCRCWTRDTGIIERVGNECGGMDCPLRERVCTDHGRFADHFIEDHDTFSVVLYEALFSDA